MIGIKLAYYRKKDWKKLLASINDRESMHETWDEWHEKYSKSKIDLTKMGFEITEVEVNIKELIEYCKSLGIQNDGKARSEFVSKK